MRLLVVVVVCDLSEWIVVQSVSQSLQCSEGRSPLGRVGDHRHDSDQETSYKKLIWKGQHSLEMAN